MGFGSAAAKTYPEEDAWPKEIFGYEVLDFVGEGAGSLIYAVSDPQTRQLYALKHVTVRSDRHVRFIEQLENEYQVGSQVNHPVLRKCLDLKFRRTLFRRVTEAALVMELVDGRPLDMQLPDDLGRIVDIFIETASGLVSLHATGYVHCDLKPNNIMVGTGSHAHEVKVIDLGQACRIGNVKERIQGTPDFIAPEQVKRGPVTVRTDVFNLGATLYWALSGRKLPTLYTLARTENSFLLDDVMAAPHTINSNVPETLSNLVMECVRTSPLKRPSDMGEVLRRLETIRHGMRTGLIPTGESEDESGARVPRSRRTSPRPLAV